jgi:hypothetical protein
MVRGEKRRHRRSRWLRAAASFLIFMMFPSWNSIPHQAQLGPAVRAQLPISVLADQLVFPVGYSVAVPSYTVPSENVNCTGTVAAPLAAIETVPVAVAASITVPSEEDSFTTD